MKVPVWILSTCLREEGRPCLPEIYPNEEAAQKAFDVHMREEWAQWAPFGEDGVTQTDYPGDPGEAMRRMREYHGRDFGEWELTKHEIDASVEPPIGVIVEDGVVQHVVSNDARLVGMDALVIDYDTDGAEETYNVKVIPQSPDHIPQAVLYDTVVRVPTGIDLHDLWRKFCINGPDHKIEPDAA
jgi:hypothetical protein